MIASSVVISFTELIVRNLNVGPMVMNSEFFTPDRETVALYHFDEGALNVAKDSSGHGHAGQLHACEWVAAR